jgi:hypothetical protein
MRLSHKLLAGLLGFNIAFNSFITPVYAEGAQLFGTHLFCDTTETGSSADELKTAKYIMVHSLTEEGLYKVLANPNLKQIQIEDISNLPVEDVAKLYPYLCEGNIEYSAILLAYENVRDSVGNDGTPAYVYAVDTYAPDSSTYYRSCATTVSAILNAAGYVDDYSSAGVSGLVTYFRNNTDEWEELGKLKPSDMQEGDVIFIDRQSHKSDYIKGIMSDPDFDLESLMTSLEDMDNENADQVIDETLDLGADGDGYYDDAGNYIVYDLQDYGYYDPNGNWCGFETADGCFGEDKQLHPFDDNHKTGSTEATKNSLAAPKGGYKNVFNPDSNEDGTVDDAEGQVWSDYWTSLGEEVPDYSYYETWKKESDEYQAKLDDALNKLDLNNLKTLNGGAIQVHNHIILWLGNDVVQKYYPDSEGNIISGSYSEAYNRARSAAVSSFNFTGDYHVFRHKS